MVRLAVDADADVDVDIADVESVAVVGADVESVAVVGVGSQMDPNRTSSSSNDCRSFSLASSLSLSRQQ